MIIFTYFSRLLKKITFFSKNDPVRDWFTVCILSTIALIGIIVWNTWVFDTIVSGGSIGTQATSTAPTFNEASLETIRSVFINRANEEQKYVSGVYRYTDPSH